MAQTKWQWMSRGKYLMLPLIFIMTACSHDMRELRGNIDTIIKETKGHRLHPAPRYVQIQPFIYVASSRDPFMSPRRRRPGVINPNNTKNCTGPVILTKRRREPLEQHPLSTLQMVGVIKRKSTLWALLKTKDGTIHRVSNSNYVGQHHGKIVNISDSKVEITEIVENRGLDEEVSGCPYRIRKAKLVLGN